MENSEEQPFIPCLNFCRTDPETGYCLTCGRPPAPVVNNVDLLRPSYVGVDLSRLQPSSGKPEASSED